ncbi:MAG: C40 family peptidase [Bilophila wadsworthia]
MPGNDYESTGPTSDHDPGRAFAYDYRSAAVARMRDEAFLSQRHLSTRQDGYRYAACSRRTSMSGFDCSGFVQWAYKSVGVSLPRTAREQSVLGTPIDSDEMEAGDIVAFRHPRRGYHTGIYVGDGKFIHSPRRGKSVEITSLSDPYFSSTFLGARRVSISESDAEAAQKLMALYESRSSRLHRTASDAALSQSKAKHVVSKSQKKGKQTLSSSRSSSKHKAVSSKKRTTVASKKAASKTSVASSKKPSSKKQVAQKRSSQKKSTSVAQKKSTSKAKSK